MKAACKVGAGLWTPIFFLCIQFFSFLLSWSKNASSQTAEQDLDRAGVRTRKRTSKGD